MDENDFLDIECHRDARMYEWAKCSECGAEYRLAAFLGYELQISRMERVGGLRGASGTD
jgi:hypothetical protein